MDQKNKKILITTKENVLNSLSKEPDLFKVFDGCTWEVYKYLLNYKYANLYDKLFCDEKTLENYLKDLKTFRKLENGNVPVFDSSVDCYFADNETFKGWLGENGNKDVFLKNVLGMNTPFLVKKRMNAELYVAPVLNEDYKEENVLYVEELIKCIKVGEGDDLYVLLHDKDLYATEEPITSRKVSSSDSCLSEKVNSTSNLKGLIKKEKVFVFTHQPKDDYYKQIVTELNNIAVVNIVDILFTIRHNVDFASSIGDMNLITSMRNFIASENEFYDFSKRFF